MLRISACCLTLVLLCSCAPAKRPKLKSFKNDYPLTAAPIESVRINDSLWAPRLKANRQTGVPHCLAQLEKSGAFGMFRTLNGSTKEGRYKNNPWGCSDVYKSLEGLIRSNRTNPDKAAVAAAGKKVDEFLKLVAGAQADDGFIFPYLQLYKKDYKPFSAALARYTETYCMGHLIEMAVEHYETTGSAEALKIAGSVADCIDKSHRPGGKYDFPSGHPEIEIALMRLHRVTGDHKYLNLTKRLIEKSKTIKTTWSQGKPAMGHDEAVGHSVAMFYLYAGAVDAAQVSGDDKLMGLIRKKWRSAALTKTYITGSCGTRGHSEGFGAPYYLPNDKAYCETCASISYCMWNHRMFLAAGEAKYMDLMERTLYNGFLSGVSPSGDRFYYPNPLKTARGKKRVPWFGCPCCPTNVVRFYPLIPTYMYSTDPVSGEVSVNLFASGRAELHLGADILTLTQKTDYPRDGKVSIAYKVADVRDSTTRTAPLRIRVRIPGWCDKPAWMLNGKAIVPKTDKGYAVFTLSGDAGEVTMNCPMPVVRMIAHPKVKADHGRVALMRGPLVYCFEGIDSPESTELALAADQEFETKAKEIMPGMTVDAVIAKDAAGAAIAAIPYFARAYRKETSMLVWTRQAGLKTPKDAEADSWKDKLYRRLDPKELD